MTVLLSAFIYPLARGVWPHIRRAAAVLSDWMRSARRQTPKRPGDVLALRWGSIYERQASCQGWRELREMQAADNLTEPLVMASLFAHHRGECPTCR